MLGIDLKIYSNLELRQIVKFQKKKLAFKSVVRRLKKYIYIYSIIAP